MGSSRLPGKSLAEVKKRPLLSYMLERLSASKLLPELILLTSTERKDDVLEDFCRNAGVRCFRGAHEDVAGRFLAASEYYGAGEILRLCADSPWIDARVIDYVLSRADLDKNDIVTNVHPRSFPKGQSVELFPASALKKAHPLMSASHKEHVTSFFYEHSQDFRILNVRCPEGNFSEKSLCVDTLEDLIRFRRFIDSSERPFLAYGWQEIVSKAV
jgi:spore coat polysaccharide biosynthesis protein SpsF